MKTNDRNEFVGDELVQVSMPALFLLASEAAQDPQTPPIGRIRAMVVADALLRVSKAHGFAKDDAMWARLPIGKESGRAVEIAYEALRGVPTSGVVSALKRAAPASADVLW